MPQPIVVTAFALAIGQLADPRVLRLLAKSIALTVLLLGALGALGLWWLDNAFALIAMLAAAWLLWRVIAFAVLQFYADEVIAVVEARYYPAAFALARPLGWRAELSRSARSAVRAIAWNIAALPFALALLVTGFGTAIVFWAANAWLLGRELTDMVWLRQPRDPDAPSPLSALKRFTLGGLVAGLLIVPLVNLLVPFIGAAMATHLIHRERYPRRKGQVNA